MRLFFSGGFSFMSFSPNTVPVLPAGRRDGLHEIEINQKGAGLRIGIVMARFNQAISDGLLSGCNQELRRLGVTEIALVTVPGALEIPLAMQAMAQSGKQDALVALGCVIRGETYHFEVVSNESASGITNVQLATGIPIANAVLTVENFEQAEVRMQQKGAEAACCAVEMVNLLNAMK
jgi:6,7-dimethyl-8-ribityllumazine synthase